MVELHEGMVEIEEVKRYMRRAEQAGCTLISISATGHVHVAVQRPDGGLTVYEVDEDDDRQMLGYHLRDYFEMLRQRGRLSPADSAALHRCGLLLTGI